MTNWILWLHLISFKFEEPVYRERAKWRLEDLTGFYNVHFFYTKIKFWNLRQTKYRWLILKVLKIYWQRFNLLLQWQCPLVFSLLHIFRPKIKQLVVLVCMVYFVFTYHGQYVMITQPYQLIFKLKHSFMFDKI